MRDSGLSNGGQFLVAASSCPLDNKCDHRPQEQSSVLLLWDDPLGCSRWKVYRQRLWAQ